MDEKICVCGAGRIDALVFSGGIGEKSSIKRQKIIKHLRKSDKKNVMLNGSFNTRGIIVALKMIILQELNIPIR